MKKFFALALTLVMVLSITACGDEDVKNNSSTETVDANTIEIVNNAFNTTKTLLSSSKALGFDGTIVRSITVDDVTSSTRYTVGIDYIDGDNGRNYACEIVQKFGDSSDEAQIYGDGKSNYAYKAGTTYILSKHKDTDEFVNNLFSDIELIDIGNCTAKKTTIVDASIGGHCFVIEYDVSNFDAEKAFGSDIFDAKAEGYTVNSTKLTVSGTVDAKGRLISQIVTYEYDYNINVQVEVEDESKTESTTSSTSSKKANSSSKTETSSEATATTTVAKKVSNVLKVDIALKYDIEEVAIPDRILIGKDKDGNEIKNTEISVTDFNKLSASASTSN